MAAPSLDFLRSISSAFCLFVLVSLAQPARAQDADLSTRGAARDLGYQGIESYKAGDFEKASEQLERAYELLKVPSLGLWSGRALQQRGKVVEAVERYLEASRLEVPASGVQSVQEQARAEAAEAYERLKPAVPGLVIEVKGASAKDVRVSVNGKVVPSAAVGTRLPTNPGEVTVIGVLGDYRVQSKVSLSIAQEQTVLLDFSGAPQAATAPVALAESTGGGAQPQKPAEATGAAYDGRDGGTSRPGRAQRTWGWVTVGVGGLVLATGATLGVLALSKESDLKSVGQCVDGRCPPGVNLAAINELNAMRVPATVGIVAGATLVAAGLTLVLTAPKAHTSVAMTPTLGGGTVSLRSVF